MNILNTLVHEYMEKRVIGNVNEREKASYMLCYTSVQSVDIKIRQWICQLSKIQIKIVTVGGICSSVSLQTLIFIACFYIKM